MVRPRWRDFVRPGGGKARSVFGKERTRNAGPSASAPRTTFFHLPRELRDKVYDYIWIDSPIQLSYKALTLKGHHPRWCACEKFHHGIPKWLTSNRQFLEEALDYMYGLFEFESTRRAGRPASVPFFLSLERVQKLSVQLLLGYKRSVGSHNKTRYYLSWCTSSDCGGLFQHLHSPYLRLQHLGICVNLRNFEESRKGDTYWHDCELLRMTPEGLRTITFRIVDDFEHHYFCGVQCYTMYRKRFDDLAPLVRGELVRMAERLMENKEHGGQCTVRLWVEESYGPVRSPDWMAQVSAPRCSRATGHPASLPHYLDLPESSSRES